MIFNSTYSIYDIHSSLTFYAPEAVYDFQAQLPIEIQLQLTTISNLNYPGFTIPPILAPGPHTHDFRSHLQDINLHLPMISCPTLKISISTYP